MLDSRGATPSHLRRYQGAALGVALVILGLCLIFAFPNDRLPWQAKGHTQPVPDCGATTDTVVCVQPPSQVAETGAQFTADIVVDKVAYLGAYEFTLTFDPTVISFVGVANGAFLGSTGRSTNCLGPFLEAGSVRYGCVTLGSEPSGPSGTGLLARVTFSAQVPGTSALDLTNVILTDISGTPLPHLDADGQVTVIAGPTSTPCPGGICPTATSTPIPTATPTPSLGPTVVRIDPASQSQLMGSILTVDVAIDAVTNLGAYELKLAFNPDVLDFVSVSNGSFLGSSGRTVFCPPPTIGANTVQFACATSGPTPDGLPGLWPGNQRPGLVRCRPRQPTRHGYSHCDGGRRGDGDPGAHAHADPLPGWHLPYLDHHAHADGHTDANRYPASGHLRPGARDHRVCPASFAQCAPGDRLQR
jgi:hypothetical protein